MTQSTSLNMLIRQLGGNIDPIVDKDRYSNMTDIQKSLARIVSAALVNFWTFPYFYDKHEGLYPLAGASRFILESYADAYYLSTHKKAAAKYIGTSREFNDFAATNPSKMQLDDFMVNKIGTLGRFNKITTKRVKDIPEIKLSNAYSLLNCYTHPNPISIDWNYNDDEGAINKYFLYVATESFFGIVKLMQVADIELDYDKLNEIRASIVNNFCAAENKK